MLALLATYHGRFWNSPRLDAEFTWLQSPKQFYGNRDPAGLKRQQGLGLERSTGFVPESHVGANDAIWASET